MTALLQPVITLAAWTMVMWLWMYATRLPAMARGKIDPDAIVLDPDMSLDKVLAPNVQWKAHNFNHLHEAPTVFYAVMLSLALVKANAEFSNGSGTAIWLAWVYVILRIAHSLVQAIINKVVLRFALFFLSQSALLALVAIAAFTVLGVL